MNPNAPKPVINGMTLTNKLNKEFDTGFANLYYARLYSGGII
jgi:hypothetical protein